MLKKDSIIHVEAPSHDSKGIRGGIFGLLPQIPARIFYNLLALNVVSVTYAILVCSATQSYPRTSHQNISRIFAVVNLYSQDTRYPLRRRFDHIKAKFLRWRLLSFPQYLMQHLKMLKCFSQLNVTWVQRTCKFTWSLIFGKRDLMELMLSILARHG
jgi:hypothetical protein